MKKATKRNTDQEIEVYKQMALIPHQSGVDLVNPVNGKWRTMKSKHAAKCMVTISENMAKRFLFLPVFANVCKPEANLATSRKSATVTKSADFVAHP